MINKKISKFLGPILGITGFIIVAGMMEAPASAQDNVQANTSYINTAANTTGAAVTVSDYCVNINKSETQNGIKVTVDKAIGTKKNLKVTLRIESDKSLDEIKYNNSIFELTYGDIKSFGHTSSKRERIDDKTILVTLERINDRGEYPQKGEMRVDLALVNYKVNIGMDIPVDFTESFNHVIDKEISGKIKALDYTLNKFQSDVMGTRIEVTKPKVDRADRDKEEALWNSSVILKVGNRMYKTHSRGSFSGEDKVRKSNYETRLATYDTVKDEKNISILPIICNITSDELDKIYSNYGAKEENAYKDTLNNVKYNKNFDFAGGTKGEIYNIERNDNTIKIYCKGQSEKEGLLMASNVHPHYHYEKGKTDNVYYDTNNMSFYKDPKEALGYIIELNKVDKDKSVEVSFDEIIKQADKYTLEDEIKLLS